MHAKTTYLSYCSATRLLALASTIDTRSSVDVTKGQLRYICEPKSTHTHNEHTNEYAFMYPHKYDPHANSHLPPTPTTAEPLHPTSCSSGSLPLALASSRASPRPAKRRKNPGWGTSVMSQGATSRQTTRMHVNKSRLV